MKPKLPKFGAFATGIFIVLLVIAVSIPMFFISIVEAGEVGVVSTFGSVSDNTFGPGINLKNPFSNVIKLNTRTQQYTMSSTSNEGAKLGDDSIKTIASDGGTVWLDVTVLYKLNPESAPEVFKTLGLNYAEGIIRPEIRSSIREEVAKYKVVEIYSTKREELANSIFEKIKGSLEGRGITTEDVLIRDVTLSESLFESIEQKLTAQQEAQKLDFLLEKEQKEAERKVIEAKGQRDAQRIINESLSDKYLYYLYITALQGSENTIYVPTEGGVPLFRNVN